MDIEKVFAEAMLLDLNIPKNRKLLEIKIKNLEDFLEELDEGAAILGHNLEDSTRNNIEDKIATLMSRLDEHDSSSTVPIKKLKWNAKVNELAGMFSELKNKPSKKKGQDGNYLPYIETTIPELVDFICKNFEADEPLSKSTIDQYLRDKNQRKNILR
jgi:hypothetical protein